MADTTSRSLLARLGLDRPELRAWILYDWANSVFMTIILMVFPIYFSKVAAAGLSPVVATARFALATTLSMTIVAILSPVLGAIADHAGMKKKMLALFLGFGAAATAALYFVDRGQWLLGAAIFVIGNIGVTGTIVFYESLLPHIARHDEVDRVSMAGYAAGYLGGGLLADRDSRRDPATGHRPDPGRRDRHAPLVRGDRGLVGAVLDPPFSERPRAAAGARRRRRSGRPLLAVAFARLGQTLRDLRRHRDAFLFLLAFLIYNDAINTIIRMASTYGTESRHPHGIVDRRLRDGPVRGHPVRVRLRGARRAGSGPSGPSSSPSACTWSSPLVGLVHDARPPTSSCSPSWWGRSRAGAQALSRSLFSTMIPRHKSAEMFGFFGVFDRFAGDHSARPSSA